MGGGGGEGLHFRWVSRTADQPKCMLLAGVQQLPPNCPPMAKQHHQIKCSGRGGTV